MEKIDVLASLQAVTFRGCEYLLQKKYMTNYVTAVNSSYGIDYVNKNTYILKLIVIKQK